jgi:hypothetical protein
MPKPAPLPLTDDELDAQLAAFGFTDITRVPSNPALLTADGYAARRVFGGDIDGVYRDYLALHTETKSASVSNAAASTIGVSSPALTAPSRDNRIHSITDY